MKKIILWSAVGILILGICAAGIWWLRRPQVIQIDKNTTLTLLGVDYGKHHKFPKISTNGRRVGQASSFDTTNDTVVVWILQTAKGQNRYGWQPLVYDRAETACVTTWARNWNSAGANKQIAAVQLDAFPRRDSKFIMRFQSWGTGGQHVTKDGFVISNPARGKTFSKWTSDPLPNTQSDGDLDVTLNKLVANAPSPYNRGNGVAKNDPINKGVQIDLDVQQKGQSATNWRPVQVETTDATGNDARGWINDYRQNGETSGYFYTPGLWPTESAWKVRLEFSRTSGFNDDELWSVTNVPVQAGSEQDLNNYWGWSGNQNKPKPAFAETTMNDTHVKLFPAIQYTSQNNNGQKQIGFVLRTDPDPETSGMRVTLISITDDQGHEIEGHNYSWGGGNYQFQMPSRNTQTINITVAIHKSRFVEFMVKPTKQ